MYNFFKVYSIVCFLILTIFISIIIESFLYELIDLIFKNKIITIILIIIVGLSVLIAIFAFSIYLISDNGWLIIRHSKIIFFGKWFKKTIITKEEIDRFYITYKVVGMGKTEYNQINMHVYTLKRPQMDLKINSKLSPKYFVKKLKKQNYKVNDNLI